MARVTRPELTESAAFALVNFIIRSTHYILNFSWGYNYNYDKFSNSCTKLITSPFPEKI